MSVGTCRLTTSKELADLIYQHYIKHSTDLSLLSLAHDVYNDVSGHVTTDCTRQHPSKVLIIIFTDIRLIGVIKIIQY